MGVVERQLPLPLPPLFFWPSLVEGALSHLHQIIEKFTCCLNHCDDCRLQRQSLTFELLPPTARQQAPAGSFCLLPQRASLQETSVRKVSFLRTLICNACAMQKRSLVVHLAEK